MIGEAGEIANKWKKFLRDTPIDLPQDEFEKLLYDKHQEMKKELGDVLWYLAQLCNELDLDLGQIADGNLSKLFDRKSRGVLQGSGDNR